MMSNAITGKRWLHHTSLLWDYDVQRMALLQQPARTPAYRQGRDHTSFVTRLSQHEPPVPNARAAFVERVVAAVRQLPGFRVQEVGMEEAAAVLAQRPLCGTRIVDLDGL
ncbi:lipoate-ligase A isoform X1 [Haematococcus lacustris]|uniref:Lipoate-ligase A isoform X1 n=1 Tax=Haematococcus lacustris TaxID=44745 RepID=A0A699ZZM5_HAELA|nr:lipoate-ligase A isoform X1 [Haematococcus lacustris]